MQLFNSLVFLLSCGTIIKATDVNGDPTNISNWPPCAQQCIPIGLGPPVNCGSLSNLTCICQNVAFSKAIASCETTKCTAEERQQINELTAPLCRPVGGFSPSLSAFISNYVSTAPPSASTLPTFPASASELSAVSTLLATATPSPNLGNPANILSYPLCAQTCNNESVALATCNLTKLDCLCGPDFRGVTAACQQVSCDVADRGIVSLLATQLCGPLYSATPTLGAAVSTAIATATSGAAAQATKDATDIKNYPLCGQKCINASLPPSGCGSLSNRACICKGPVFNHSSGACEQASCDPPDLRFIADLADELCNPVGGFANQSNVTISSTAGAPSASVSVFTGGVGRLTAGWTLFGMVGIGLSVGLGL